MKPFLARHGLSCGLLALWTTCCAATPPEPRPGDATDDLFHSTNLLLISITLPEEGWRELATTTSGSGRSKPKARALVHEGGRTYRDVAVQLKGTTTFQPLEGTPSLTLDFNQFVPGQRFHGLAKVSLNNSLQDPTRLHEKLARELFAAAGVPVPRSDHALLTLNGRELGLYVLVEGYDKDFLQRHFTDATGNFYEGGTLQDVDQPLQLKSGPKPDDRSDLDRLLRAAREPDPARRIAALAEVVDLERFFAMVAVEAMLCHSDSYSMNRNNYRLYHDPASDRFVFLPHGMDRLLGTHRSNLSLPIVPPAMGLVARAVLSTPEGRRRYVMKAGTLFTNLFDAGRLGRRVREIDEKIRRGRLRLPGDRESWGGSGRSPAADAADLSRRIEGRAAELGLQFAQIENLLAVSPVPEFDLSGNLKLTHWRVRWVLNEPRAEVSVVERDGRPLLQVRSAGDALVTTLYCRLRLPLDSYRLSGRMAPVSPPELRAPLTVLRHSASRFNALSQPLGNREANYSFRVAPVLAPEEVEFTCQVRAETNLVWLDPDSLLLTRGNPTRE